MRTKKTWVIVIFVLIPLIVLPLFFHEYEKESWLEVNQPYMAVTFLPQNGNGHIVKLIDEGNYSYTAYIPSECGGSPIVDLGYMNYIQIGEQRYYSGDVILGINAGKSYSFQIFGDNDTALCEGSIVFYYADNVASLYIDTESGTMSSINASSGHSYEENAKFYVIDAEGNTLNTGQCTIKGRGNSTWLVDGKKPYNIECNMPVSLLGMSKQSKWTLLANLFDGSELRTMVAMDAAEALGMPTVCECEFANLYLNGEYAGLYLVSQHVDVTGGNVDITDLGQKNSDINNYETIMSSISEISEEGHRVTYFDGISPSDISGGYLMEFVSPTYSGQEASFSTDHQRILIESPKYATKEEVYYISEYINNVEDAIFDRTDSVYRDYIDMESWTSMYLLREFFFSWDAENNSSYMYKDSGSDVLYCGPAWDYDLSMGQTYGCHSNYTSQVIWLEGKENISWLYSLMKNHPDFEEEVIQKYYTELLPFMNDELNNKMPSMYEHIKSSAEMDYIRYPSEMRLHYKGNFDEEYNYLTDWLCARRDFYSDYFKNENEYICVRFEGRNLFAYYIKPGDVINEIPLEDGNVVTWIYAETGEELKIGDIINESTVLEIKE